MAFRLSGSICSIREAALSCLVHVAKLLIGVDQHVEQWSS